MRASYKAAGVAMAGLLIVGAVALRHRTSSESTTTGQRDGTHGQMLEGAGETPRRSFASSPAIRTRPVSSAAQHDYEGLEPGDWDTLTRDQRIARTEEAIEVLKTKISEAMTPEHKQALEEQALEILAQARADYFQEEESMDRYIELEASLGG